MSAESIAPFRFDRLDAETHREISRRGGKASGERRRALAEAVDTFNDALILYALRNETRTHFREAIQRYAAQEQRKRRRRKPLDDD